MSLKHLRAFVAVYQEKNITRAAQKLGFTQPATSLALKELEAHYQTKLFERNGRGIRITTAGEHLYPDAVRLLSLYDEMDQGMKNWNQTGTLRIGSSISIGSCILPELMNQFSELYPELDVYVKVDSSNVIERYLLENELDFALIEGTPHAEKLHSEVFLDDELIPICDRFHSLAGEQDVPLESLRHEKFLMREKNSGTRALADSSFAVKGFRIQPIWESTSTTALVHAVAAGLGISILPKRMVEPQLQAQQITSFSIRGISLKRHYHLVYHENKFITPAMQDFFSLLFPA